MAIKPTYEDLEQKLKELEKESVKLKGGEEALHQEKKLADGIINSLPGIFYMFDEKRFVRWNKEWEIITGYSPEELGRMYGPDFFEGADKEHIADRMQAVFREGASTAEAELMTKDGRRIPYYFSGLRVVFDGKPYLIGMGIDITERKQTEVALEKRIVALTRPLDDSGSIAFEDLFNLDDIQRLQDEFAKATGVGSIVTDTEGTPITRPSNFCRLCNDIIRKTEKGRAKCHASDAVLGRLNPGGPIIQPCLSAGLCNAGAAISVGGRHIANWLIGQVRDGTLSEENIREYARDIEADEDAAVEAFREVPAMSREQFEQVAQALFTVAKQLSTTAYQNVQQARFITERKQAEDALRESEKRYRLLADNITDNIWVLNLDTLSFSYVSPSVAGITGYSAHEAMGLYLEDVLTPASMALAVNVLNEEMSAESQNTDPSRSRILEFEQYHKDGSTVWTEASMRFIYDNDGRPTSILGVTRDISERKRLQNQLQQAQKMEAIGTLAGGIAHDFNNILSPLVGYSEMLKGDIPSDSPLQSYIDEILHAALRSRDLVKQILAFSRQGDQDIKPIKLQPIAKEALKLLRSSIPTTIDFQQDIDPDCGVVVADPTQVHQIIMNLAANAYHAMEDTGGRLTVNLKQVRLESDQSVFSESTPGEYALLTVSDTGTGIEKDILDKIFDPYFTTKEKDKGTGLGLSVVQGIVKSNNGGIRIYSEPGKGTEIHVYLPIMDRRVDDVQIDRSEPIRGGTERILLVDDEEAIVMMEQQMLERLGYQVTIRTGSLDALEAFKANPNSFDLVVTDMTMPNMTGLQLTGEIKKIRPDIPVILCTGFSHHVDDEKSQAMGIQGFVMKPVVMKEFAEAIRKALDMSEES
jgi:PAS domain S-box-containing protein